MGIFDSGLKAYRPILRGGINVTSVIEGQVAELRAPTVEGRFLQYQWYKDGEEIPMPIPHPTPLPNLIRPVMPESMRSTYPMISPRLRPKPSRGAII